LGLGSSIHHRFFKFVLLILQLSDPLIQVAVNVMIVYGIVAIEQIIEFCPVAALKP
jgi:hypothetical protein